MTRSTKHLGTAFVVLLAAGALTACGVQGAVADYGDTRVEDEPGGRQIATLTTMNEVTVQCHLPAGPNDYSGYYKVSFDGGSGYIDDTTEILTDGTALRHDSVPEC